MIIIKRYLLLLCLYIEYIMVLDVYYDFVGIYGTTSCKPVRYTEKLLKIKSKLILIPFTFFIEYAFFFFFL
jgi:hypothetical protein